MQRAAIRKFSHHFTVRNLSPAFRSAVRSFASEFVQFKTTEQGGAWVREVADYFFAWDAGKNVYRFHINTFEKFKEKLASMEMFEGRDFEVSDEPFYEPVRVDFGDYLPPYTTPLEDQVAIIPQLETENPRSKFLGLQTGGGKSYLSCVSMRYWKFRTLVHTKPAYLEKTAIDLKRIFKMNDEDIVIVAGSGKIKSAIPLQELIRGIMMGYLNPKVILLSNQTYSNWISAHLKLEDGEFVPGFDCLPEDFFQVCGIGHRIIDEAHQNFHMNFILDLFTHVESGLNMTATLETRDPYVKDLYEIAFPAASHCKLPEYKKFARVMVWYYDFLDLRGIRTSQWGKSSYSHVEFEKSVLRNPRVLKQYLFMCSEVIRKYYRPGRKEGEKCLVWFATRRMCELARDNFKTYFPDLHITKYNQGDPYSNLMEADICCATLGKSGTNVDIKNLCVAILTIGIDAIAANLQAYGRMRDNKKLYGAERDPLFVYFVCNNFKKHKDYDKSKSELLRSRSIGFTYTQHNVSLGH